jgi:serine-type D-Ala-D-Ala carboxypeptidase (penicillin-binding protein 5/6)
VRIPARVIAVAAAGGVLIAASVAWAVGTSPRPEAPAAASVHPPATWPDVPGPSPGPPTAAELGIAVVGSPGGVKAKGAVLADAATGTRLWSRDLNTERPIGSVTKVMTALVVIRAGNLDRKIKVPKAVIAYVTKYQADSAGLHPGDILTARQLLEAMLLPSGCDAAYTLAMTYGPGLAGFLAKMNATAKQLGMLHTHFTSPDGLPYPTERSTFSTPADLLKLGLAAMKYPAFAAIVAQHIYQIPKGPGHHHYWWENTNELLGAYPGAIGIKTGFTNAARHCLLFEAVRHGFALIGVVLGSPATGPGSGADDAARVLNWGFGLPGT